MPPPRLTSPEVTDPVTPVMVSPLSTKAMGRMIAAVWVISMPICRIVVSSLWGFIHVSRRRKERASINMEAYQGARYSHRM